MPTLERAYQRSPVLGQHAMATAFGVRERYRRYGGNFRAYRDELDRGQWLSAEQLVTLQSARLREMVSFAVDHVPYYQRLFAELRLTAADVRSPEDLSQLPVLDKATVREHPDQFRPDRLLGRPISQTTGGTTGAPLRYWVTASALQYSYAAYEVRFRNWAGVALGNRMASLNGRKIVPVEQTKPPFWRHNLAFNQLYLSAYHLTDSNLPAYIRRLERYCPEVIVGYVSSVHLLAAYINRHGLERSIQPRAVLLSSETLFPWIRSEIERAFGCKVHEAYGLGELSAFISECRHERLHASPEYGVVEGVEIDGETRLVATGLFNKAMPLLRYDTGDVVKFGATGDLCACGRSLPVVDNLLGRADDYVVTPDGRSVGPAALSLAFQEVQGLREAQITQQDPSSVDVSLVVGPDFGAEQQSQLERELRQRLGRELTIGYERVASIPRTSWGKRRLIESHIGRSDGGSPENAR